MKTTEAKRAQNKRARNRYYNLNSILGNDWAMFYAILGARKTGKSYSVTEHICKARREYGDNVKVYWLRIADTSVKALLSNKARNLVDPDLVRKYDLELSTRAGVVYNHGKTFCECYPLASFGKLKGQAFYDKDFKGKYIIVLDEFQLEQGEKRTSFDILYNFIGMLENIARTTKDNVQVFLLGNTLEESSTILKAFNFLPEKFGRFYLKSKRCVMDNLEPTDEYLEDRYGSMADILGGDRMSNYTNELTKDIKLINKARTIRPKNIIKFKKGIDGWYTLWDNNIIKKFNKEIAPEICMRPYIGGFYNPLLRDNILELYDAEALYYHDLITQSYFTDELMKIRKT